MKLGHCSLDANQSLPSGGGATDARQMMVLMTLLLTMTMLTVMMLTVMMLAIANLAK
jgi:hypothetical protein